MLLFAWFLYEKSDTFITYPRDIFNNSTLQFERVYKRFYLRV